jgi:CRP-like cAMP-binding protein
MIGLASAVLGTVKHSVQAITPVSLCVLESRDFPELFNAHPGFALNILQTRVEEEQRGDVRLSLLGRSRADQRIGYLMLETFDRLRQRGIVDGGSTCPFSVAKARSCRRRRTLARPRSKDARSVSGAQAGRDSGRRAGSVQP